MVPAFAFSSPAPRTAPPAPVRSTGQRWTGRAKGPGERRGRGAFAAAAALTSVLAPTSGAAQTVIDLFKEVCVASAPDFADVGRKARELGAEPLQDRDLRLDLHLEPEEYEAWHRPKMLIAWGRGQMAHIRAKSCVTYDGDNPVSVSTVLDAFPPSDKPTEGDDQLYTYQRIWVTTVGGMQAVVIAKSIGFDNRIVNGLTLFLEEPASDHPTPQQLERP